MFDWNIALGNFMEEELEEKYKLYISVEMYLTLQGNVFLKTSSTY